MYLFKITPKESSIEGKGVFADENINKGDIVWKFNPEYDISLPASDFNDLDIKSQEVLEKVGYLSNKSNSWIYPPENDPARFTNHSISSNNLSVVFDEKISREPFFVANRDIKLGEELIVNYLEFDEYIKDNKPDWI